VGRERVRHGMREREVARLERAMGERERKDEGRGKV